MIAGLGNPGLRYKNTRHNAGFMAIDYLSQKWGVKLSKGRGLSQIGETTEYGAKVVLAKPQTYMNRSGQAIKELMDYYKIPADRILVIYDDMDVELGKIRIRKKGGPGSHNGMKSVIHRLETENFPRIRIGIGNAARDDAIDYVLGRFKKEEKEAAFAGIESAALAAEQIVKEGIDAAMNKFNGNKNIE